jgi:pilus assembly protein FimV
MAAGLGKLAVMSGLGQPLRAEIEVVSLQRGEAETLAARIASPDAFRQAGVEYGALVPQVRAALERRGDNRYVVTLSTPGPVEEPFLDLLVELSWATGRLVRQYTFLLDPAEYKGPQAITAPPAVAAAPQVQPVQPPATPPAAAATPAAPPAPARTPTPRAATGTYEVKQGDTLGKIAAENRPEGVTQQQMLVALFRANPDAFINNNMNLVRAGRVLTIPDRAAAEAVAQPEANQVVLAQAQEFNEYRARVAGAVAAAPARAEAPQQRAAGRITAAPAEGAAAAPAAPRDELRISKADAAKSAKAAAAARADDLAARERALKEANERVADLERNVKDMQRLLELKNQQLAELQKQAEAAKAAPAAPKPEAPKPPGEVAKAPEPPPAAAPKPEPAPPAAKPEAPKPEAQVVAAAPAEKPAAPDAPKAAPAAASEAPKAAAPTPPKPAAAPAKPAAPPPPEPSFVEQILDEPLYLAAGGGGILALLIGGYLWRKKRSATLENSLLGATTTDSSSVFGTTGGRSVDTGGSSLQTDFSQSGIGSIDTDEVDPVAEADVYMAYGRDAQAEEILKEALQKDPNRQAVRVKLLEIYASRKDLKAFETTAGELYAATGGAGPEWAKAAELGQQLDPANPLYGGRPGAVAPEGAAAAAGLAAGAAAAAVAPATDLALDLGAAAPPAIDFDLDTASIRAAAQAPDLALDVASQAPTDLAFDLSLGPDTEKPVPEEASDFSPSGTFIMDAATKKAVSEMVEAQGDAGSLAIDFELPGAKPAAADATSTFGDTARLMAQSQPTNIVDFEFKPEPPKAAATASQAMDLGSISFDLGSPAAGAAPVDARWQEVATKLDLAKAYEEMGDKDGARELLNEVIKEGDAAQQQQAKSMLATLA